MTQVRTNLGPLTTPFTYPASCNVVVQECSTCNLGWQGQSCGANEFNTQGVQDNLDCWPPRSTDTFSAGVAVNGWGFYSPGLECPVGYSTACSATGGVDGTWTFQFAMTSHETAVGCCPTGYTCSYNPGVDAAQTCYKYHVTGSFPTVQCSSGTSNAFSYVTVPATIKATTTTGGVRQTDTVVLSNVLVMAPLIQINWQPSDLTLASATSTGSGATIRTSTVTGAASPTNSTTGSAGTVGPSSTTSPSSSGLSKGATIGITVGAVVGFLILVAICTIWMRRRRQRPKVMPTLPPNTTTEYKLPHEIGTTYVAEAPTERDAHEVDASAYHKGGSMSPRYEMAG